MEKSLDNLDIVEITMLRLLDAGYSRASASEIMGFDTGYVISVLVDKGVLNPDTTFRTGGVEKWLL